MTSIEAKREPAPKAFISYSWTSQSHKDWVLQLAESLREYGVDIILDRWDLKEGHDANAFMEKMVTDESVSKVIIVCDAAYAIKANDRKGGVGTEPQIISPSIYASTEQDKFVVVAREKDADGKAIVPAFYGSRIHIDMCDEDIYSENFEQLVRWIFGKPLNPKPRLGKKPSFLEDDSQRAGSQSKLSFAISKIRNRAASAETAVADYLDTLTSDLDGLRLNPERVSDDDVVKSIDNFKPTRDQLSDLFHEIAQHDQFSVAAKKLFSFLEQLADLQLRPPNVGRYQTFAWDNFKFICTETFLLLTMALIRWERFDDVNTLLSHHFFSTGQSASDGKLKPFTQFNQHLVSLSNRKQRLKLNRLSLKADLLKNRCRSDLEFRQMMQAELILYLRETLDNLGSTESTRSWNPKTLVFADEYHTFEVFIRAQSQRYFKNIFTMLGIDGKTKFNEMIIAAKQNKVFVPQNGWGYIPVWQLCNDEKLGSLA